MRYSNRHYSKQCIAIAPGFLIRRPFAAMLNS
jgi:hypothetical protein